MAGLGLSMGAVALILAAAEAPDLRAVVADGMYPSLTQAIARRCDLLFGPMGPLARQVVNHVVRRQFGVDPAAIAPLDLVAELEDRPTLYIHSDRDIYVDVAHAEAFLDRSLEPKALWRSNARHCRAIEADPEGYARQVLDFLAEHGL
jgi:fermentation-respiration switch protein FrsA (DUF1100 family)